MVLGGGASCVKYLLFCFNLLFAISGLIILGVGSWVKVFYTEYIDFVDTSDQSAPIILIVVGVIIFIVAFFGCCGAVKENHCMIITFSVFLLIIFVLEITVGIIGYVKHGEIEEIVSRRFNESIANYPTNTELRKTLDMFQTDLKCCGSTGPENWEENNIPIPNSCCAALNIKDNTTVSCTITSPELYKQGCLPQLVSFFQKKTLALGGAGIGIALVQLLGVIFACCLARSIRREYETV